MRRHDFDGLSFLFGLLFAGAGLVLLGGAAVRGGVTLPWAGPAVAIGRGILIVFAARPRPEPEAAQTALDLDPAAADDAGDAS